VSEVTDRVLGLLSVPGAADELADVLGTSTDAERRQLSAPVRAAAGRVGWRPDLVLACAVLGTATGVRQVATALESVPVPAGGEAVAVRVLADRRPPWLADLPAALLRGEGRGTQARLLRALAVAGLVEPPVGAEYAEALARGLGWQELSSQASVLDDLRADPGLLDRDLWTVLETERIGRLLQFADGFHDAESADAPGEPARRHPERTWRHALVTLAAEGAVDRGRLLDATLRACLADWSAADLTWYVRLHEALTPGSEELADRQGTYARLLAVSFGPAVTLALQSLGRLQREGRLDVPGLLASAPAVLARTDKTSVWSALRLLGRVATSRPEWAEPVAAVVVAALQHPRTDVQERAGVLLAELVPDPGRRAVLTGAGPAEEPVAAATPGPSAAPRPLVPTGSPDELAELFTRLVEEAGDPAEVELLLDGALRWAGRRPGAADVLGARAEELLAEAWPGPWSGEDLRADLAALALVWLGRRRPGPGPTGRRDPLAGMPDRVASALLPSRLGRGSSLGDLVTRRVHEAATAVHGGGGVLLSLPTTADGQLDAETLSRRVEALPRTVPPRPIDAAVGLLRVPPEHHGDLRLPALHRTGRHLAAQLQALQERDPQWSRAVDDTGEVRRRHGRPWTRPAPQRPVAWRDAAPPPTGLDGPLAAVLDRADPLATFGPEEEDGEYAGRFEQVTACWPLLLPHHPDLLAAWAHPRLHRALTRNRSGTEPLLDALGRSSRPVGGPGHSALLLGLAARNGAEVTHAVDALLDLHARGGLDGASLGAELDALLRAEAVVGSRVAAGLAEVFRSEPATAGVLLDGLVAAQDAVVGRRDAHLFVDLLARLAVAAGRTVRLPDALAAVAQGTARSQLALAARRVPQPGREAT
jgi:hypothetical protein